jgi:hypothetical protein
VTARAALAIGVAVAAIGAPACRKREAPAPVVAADADAGTATVPAIVVLDEVRVTRVEPRRAAALDEAALAARARAALIAGAIVAPDAAPPGARRIRATLALSDDVHPAGDGVQVVVAVEAALAWVDRPAGELPGDRVIAQRTVAAGEAEAAAVALADETVGAVGAELAARRALQIGDDAGLLAALDGEEPERLRFALGLVGERRLRPAAPRLLVLLRHDDAAVAGAALGALVALGDPRQVSAIVDGVDFADHDRLRTLLEAVTALGGPDAVEFLEFVASGHPDAELRERASEGIRRIERRGR